MTLDTTNHVLAGHNGIVRRKVKRACTNLSLAPAANAKVDSSQPLNIQWDNSCFSPAPTGVDIYLTAPYNANPTIHTWTGVDYSAGSFSVNLLPKWWNSTTSVTLQLNIVEAGQPAFLTQFPSASTFTATYDPATAATNSQAAAAADTAVPDSPYTTVNNAYHNGGLTKGQLAAAVLMPLLAVFGCLAVYVKISRTKEAKKRQRWSQAVDKRMSTISGDWKSMSGAAANHAIRQSMAISTADRGTKGSSFFAGNGPLPPRPSSTFSSAEPGQAGLGARYGGLGLGGSLAASSDPDMTQLRRPTSSANSPTARVSRISFATDVHPRPSMGDSMRTSIYTRNSRAFHRGTVYGEDENVPPLPNKSTDDMQLSPTQTDGPAPLTPSEIRAKITVSEYGRPSVDELLRMPAMTMMRTSDATPDLVLKPTPAPIEYPDLPTSPPAVASPTSSAPASSTFSGMTPLHATSTSFTSPDAMLKAYAAAKTKPSSQSLTSKKSMPHIQKTSSANGGMRVLYAPANEESAYDEDAYSQGAYTSSTYGGTAGHEHTDSLITEEGVVTYGQRAQALSVAGDNNPFRRSQAVSGAFTEGSRYSHVDGSTHAQ